MDIAVVDDEKAIREHICGLVEEQQPESRIEAYATGEELLASGKRFDIVFLDIQMEGMNGIEAARSLRERREDTMLVFVTGIKDYVFDAFDLYAFQYLLKPIDEEKFAEVLERAVREAAKKKERRVLFIKSRNLTVSQLGTNNLGVYLRKMAVDGYIVKLDLPELSELLSLLRRTSNNINQVARRVHETGNIYDTDLEDILQKQKELWDGVNEILSCLGGIP
ncbi:MAG: response regulator [Schaedlerella sp.]